MIKQRLMFGLGLWLVTAVASAAPVQTFKLATIAPDGSAWMTEFRAAATEIGRRTDGRVAFKFYPGGVMGNSQSVLRKMRIGQLHGGAFTGGEIAEIYPDSRIYGLPLVFRDQAELDAVRRAMDPVFSQGLERAGFVNFGFADGGFAVLMSSSSVARIEDLKRHKAWVPEGDPASYAMIQALGIPPVTLPLTDVMTGLSTGLVGTIGASPLGAVALQWHTKLKYYTENPFAWLMGVLVIDAKHFARISAPDQAVVRDVLGGVFRKLDAQNRTDDQRAREALRRQGLQAQRFAPAELERLEGIALEVNQRLAGEGAFDAALYARVLRLTREHRAAGAQR